MSEANTIWIQLYTPGGAKLGVTLGFADGKFTETLPDVALIDAMIAEKGYLLTAPGVVPGADVETITSVMKRMQINKDGSQTPCIGLYHEADGLKYVYWAIYLNKSEDVAAFEAATGLQVANLPTLEDSSFPLKSDPYKQKFFVKLPQPVQIQVIKEKYTKEDGSEGTRVKSFEGFHGVTKPAPAQTPPPASVNGNTGSQGSAPSGSGATTDDMLMGYTKHMYAKNPAYQPESIKTLRANGVLTPDMKPFVAACHVFMHRVHADYMIAEVGMKEILGGSLKEYLAQDGHNLETAWDKIVASELAITNERQLTS